jgi:hypothetical protein
MTMVAPQLVVSGTLPRDPALYARDHARFLRDTLRDTAVMHHREHIPRHFMHFAAAKYGYRPRLSVVRRGKGRSRSGRLTYQQLKDQLGLPPLVSPRVDGGKTRIAVTSTRQVTATQHRARLILRLPFRGGTGRFRMLPGQRQLTEQQQQVLERIAEIETISPDEQRTINAFIAREYAARANAPGVRTRLRRQR